jgi:hypothetical protein
MRLKALKLFAVLAILALSSVPAFAAGCVETNWTQSWDPVFHQWLGVRTCASGCSEMWRTQNGQWVLISTDCPPLAD